MRILNSGYELYGPAAVDTCFDVIAELALEALSCPDDCAASF